MLSRRHLHIDTRNEGDLGEEPGPWLVARGDDREYSLNREAGLLRAFRLLAKHPSDDGIVTFASKYGGLWSPRTYMLSSRLEASFDDRGRVYRLPDSWGEPLRLWWRELYTAQAFFALDDEIVAANRDDSQSWKAFEGLSSWVLWRDDELVVRRPDNFENADLPLLRVTRQEATERFGDGDLLGPANYFLASRVNAKLSGQVDLRILPFHGNHVRYFPRDLLAAIYVQFALRLASASDRQRECANPYCSNVVIGRRQRKYCSDACSARARQTRWAEKQTKEAKEVSGG